MLQDVNDDGYVAFKRAAEDREVDTERERGEKGCQNPIAKQKTTNVDDFVRLIFLLFLIVIL